VVGHVSPEAAVGGPLALLEDGDRITIDAAARRVDVDLTQTEFAERRKKWRPPASSVNKGVLAKYRSQVSSASLGAVTLAAAWCELDGERSE
jgi:dihydroxy-acid dehydratase